MLTLRARTLAALLLTTSLTACGGGGGGSGMADPTPITPVPAPSSIGDFPDPFILPVAGTFYAYATNGQGKNVQALRSTDRVRWTVLADAMPNLASWARPNAGLVWAPEVIRLGNRYLLYYTARDNASDRQCVGVAVSSAPEGPFLDSRSTPLVCQAAEGGTIDASPFLDGTRLYLYFKNDGNCCGQPTRLYGQELAADGLSLIGTPTRLLTNQRPWEGPVIEAPTMIARAGRYELYYSGNHYLSADYAVGYATCTAPLGPCVATTDSPFLRSRTNPTLIGPGHAAIFQVGTQSWIAYHAWEELAGGRRGARRFLYIDTLGWVDGRPVVGGPTMVP